MSLKLIRNTTDFYDVLTKQEEVTFYAPRVKKFLDFCGPIMAHQDVSYFDLCRIENPFPILDTNPFDIIEIKISLLKNTSKECQLRVRSDDTSFDIFEWMYSHLWCQFNSPYEIDRRKIDAMRSANVTIERPNSFIVKTRVTPQSSNSYWSCTISNIFRLPFFMLYLDFEQAYIDNARIVLHTVKNTINILKRNKRKLDREYNIVELEPKVKIHYKEYGAKGRKDYALFYKVLRSFYYEFKPFSPLLTPTKIYKSPNDGEGFEEFIDRIKQGFNYKLWNYHMKNLMHFRCLDGKFRRNVANNDYFKNNHKAIKYEAITFNK